MTDAVNKDARDKVIVRQLGKRTYEPVWQAMQTFTDQRTAEDADEIWLVEHEPVFTQGQAGKAEHILMPGDIPVVQVDRGGQPHEELRAGGGRTGRRLATLRVARVGWGGRARGAPWWRSRAPTDGGR